MHLYMSGTAKNDAFQALENQMCSHRLFSMHGDYAREVMKWLSMAKAGVRTFDEQCEYEPALLARLERRDREQSRLLAQRGIAERWVPYAVALREASNNRSATIPSHIMLDSGAFTAWNAGARVTLDEVLAAYTRFLTEADGLFDEVWLINLDSIPGERGRDPTQAELQYSFEESDRNLSALRSEFGDRVLPVFHQGEGRERLLSIVDQAKGYLCLSPNNAKPEAERTQWAQLARLALRDLACNVETHGLATTGNEMIREAGLASGDSAAWNQHGFQGQVDLLETQTTRQNNFTLKEAQNGDLERENQRIAEKQQPRYRGYHIGVEMDDFDLNANEKMIDNDHNISFLPKRKQEWIRGKVESYFPWPMALVDQRARGLICMGELRAYSEAFKWQPPGVKSYQEGHALPYPFSEKLRAYPLKEDRDRFLTDRMFEGRL